MNFLRAGIPGDDYAYILSFRRQIYVLPNDDKVLPSYLDINFEDTPYRIFLSFDVTTCFICKKSGHLAATCQEKMNNYIQTDIPNTETQNEDTSNNIDIPQPSEESSLELPEILNLTTSDAQKNNKPTKRQASTSPLVSPEFTQDNILLKSSPEIKVNKHKRLKTPNENKNIPFKEQITSVQKYIENSEQNFILNFEQLSSFLENSFGSADPLSIAQDYTHDIPSLLTMLKSIYPHCKHRALKNRLTRMQKKMKLQLNIPNTDISITDISTGYDSDDSLSDFSFTQYVHSSS